MTRKKICGWSQGGTCSKIVDVGVRYCLEHEKQRGWVRGRNETRTNRPEHEARRARILKRDNHSCQLRYPGICLGTATICDHIVALGLGGADTDENCAAACLACSRKKTSIEGHLAQGHNVEMP